jgi:hypothetical protein
MKQLYAAIDARSVTICHAFYVEAGLLWKAERTVDSLCTVAALQLFSGGCILQGHDKQSQDLLVQSIRMAKRMGLLGVEHDDAQIAYLRDVSPKVRRATAYVAWGAHNALA